jgi:hypothetical protein
MAWKSSDVLESTRAFDAGGTDGGKLLERPNPYEIQIRDKQLGSQSTKGRESLVRRRGERANLATVAQAGEADSVHLLNALGVDLGKKAVDGSAPYSQYLGCPDFVPTDLLQDAQQVLNLDLFHRSAILCR